MRRKSQSFLAAHIFYGNPIFKNRLQLFESELSKTITDLNFMSLICTIAYGFKFFAIVSRYYLIMRVFFYP